MLMFHFTFWSFKIRQKSGFTISISTVFLHNIRNLSLTIDSSKQLTQWPIEGTADHILTHKYRESVNASCFYLFLLFCVFLNKTLNPKRKRA